MISAKAFIKKISNIPNEFIDDFFSFYKESTLQTDLVIDLDKVANWLDCPKYQLIRTLKLSYIKNIDYKQVKSLNVIKKDPRSNNYKKFLITPDCFKRLCMMTRSSKGDTIRSYFIDIENNLIKYRQELLDGIKNNVKKLQKSKLPNFKSGDGYIYVLKALDYENVYKLGKSNDLEKRLRSYRVGKADDIHVEYIYKTENITEVEGCIKALLGKYQFRKNKEIYKLELSKMKDFVNGCATLGNKLLHHKKLRNAEQYGGDYYAIIRHVDKL